VKFYEETVWLVPTGKGAQLGLCLGYTKKSFHKQSKKLLNKLLTQPWARSVGLLSHIQNVVFSAIKSTILRNLLSVGRLFVRWASFLVLFLKRREGQKFTCYFRVLYSAVRNVTSCNRLVDSGTAKNVILQ
jgi:hypothetical protein